MNPELTQLEIDSNPSEIERYFNEIPDSFDEICEYISGHLAKTATEQIEDGKVLIKHISKEGREIVQEVHLVDPYGIYFPKHRGRIELMSKSSESREILKKGIEIMMEDWFDGLVSINRELKEVNRTYVVGPPNSGKTTLLNQIVEGGGIELDVGATILFGSEMSTYIYDGVLTHTVNNLAHRIFEVKKQIQEDSNHVNIREAIDIIRILEFGSLVNINKGHGTCELIYNPAELYEKKILNILTFIQELETDMRSSDIPYPNLPLVGSFFEVLSRIAVVIDPFENSELFMQWIRKYKEIFPGKDTILITNLVNKFNDLEPEKRAVAKLQKEHIYRFYDWLLANLSESEAFVFISGDSIGPMNFTTNDSEYNILAENLFNDDPFKVNEFYKILPYVPDRWIVGLYNLNVNKFRILVTRLLSEITEIQGLEFHTIDKEEVLNSMNESTVKVDKKRRQELAARIIDRLIYPFVGQYKDRAA